MSGGRWSGHQCSPNNTGSIAFFFIRCFIAGDGPPAATKMKLSQSSVICAILHIAGWKIRNNASAHETGFMNEEQRKIYAVICKHDGIKARDIARETGADRSDINRQLYANPFVHDLCYRDDEFYWHSLIRQVRPHTGLSDFCGYYASVDRFLAQPEEDWLEELKQGCRDIGRNLNDTRGLFHSFQDTRRVMLDLFRDMEGVDYHFWEICFELRIKRARYIRIYADVLVITEDKVFSLEFKMKDVIDPDEEQQALKYAQYLDVIFGDGYEVISALVLTRASDLYVWKQLPGSVAEIPVCSGDMLFNVFDEFIGFLG